MANLFKKNTKQDSSELVGKREKGAREVKNLTKDFISKIKGLSQVQMIDLIYSNFFGRKPEPTATTPKKLSKILFEQSYGGKIKETDRFLKNKKKAFKFSRKQKAVMKKSRKKPRSILVWYLNVKGFIEPPRLYPMYSSDMIIIKNKPYQVDPRAFWRMGKYQCLLIKEIDRRPVSNLDYDEIKARGDSTDSDEFIIKAAMQAIIGKPKKKPVNKTVIIIIGILVLLGLIYFLTQ